MDCILNKKYEMINALPAINNNPILRFVYKKYIAINNKNMRLGNIYDNQSLTVVNIVVDNRVIGEANLVKLMPE